MSILNLSFQGNSVSAGLCVSVPNSIAAGFRVNALAKKTQSQQQKSNRSQLKGRVGFDRVKKGAPAENGLDSDVAEVARPNLAPDSNVSELTKTNLGLTSPPAVDGLVEKGGQETNELLVAERGAVLKAFTGTSAGLALAGFLLRQFFPDIANLMPFRTELFHLVPTFGVAVVVTSLRHILQQIWPDFAQSSEFANKQVLTSLEPVDILTISCLSGGSEELLFRGGVLPLLGPDWRGVLGAGLIFGVLHVTGGRNTAFAVWASFVGVVYGILGLYTCDLAAPMTAHSIANLLGAAIWKVSKSDEGSEAV